MSFKQFAKIQGGLAALALSLALVFFHASKVAATPTDPCDPSDNVNVDELEKQLTTSGLHGWIHGAAADLEQYVFTWRAPGDFFTYMNFSVVAHDPKVRDQLHRLHRHDEIVIKGELAENPSPQKHILIKEIQVVKTYDPGISVAHYQRVAKLPDDLVGKQELLGTVHAALDEGGILVVEYKDAVVPVYVEDNTYTKTLYRGDKIRLHYKLLPFPRKPTHLMLDTSVPKPIEVLDSVVALHGRAMEVNGVLAFFPKSPEIAFDVFAVHEVDANGLKRNFTLVNLNNAQVFQAVRAKLEKIWKGNVVTAQDGRNMYLNPKIRISVKGIGNVICASQANPQISLASADDITILP